MPYDLFISYSRQDNDQGRITQLVECIQKDFTLFTKRELLPFFDKNEIHGMEDWKLSILKGLRESRLLLACLSPTYLKSKYCEWEFIEYLKDEIGHLNGFNGVAPIYFVEVPGWSDLDFDQKCASWIAELRSRQNFDLRPWYEQGEDALREAFVQERMGKLNSQIVETIMRGERAEKSLGNVDAHNPHFKGRTASLRMLRENFVKPGNIGVITAVNGVGGLGKTALAIEYAHSFAHEYGGGRWLVRCAGKDDLRLAIAELATPMGFEYTDEEKKNSDLQFERTRYELKKLAEDNEPPRCLLLLDNVDHPNLLTPSQVSRLNGGDWLHVLATTRLGENELHGKHKDRSFLAVDELPPEDALRLLESYQPSGSFQNEAELTAAKDIVKLLGCFTLAVESAAVYLGQFADDVSCAAFLLRLKKEGLEGLDNATDQSSEGVLHGEKRLTATLQPTIEKLGVAEKQLLGFAAQLPPDHVALTWLRVLVSKTIPEMGLDAAIGYPDPWNNTLRTLLSLRLLQATDVKDTNGKPIVVRVHRILSAIVKQTLSNDQYKLSVLDYVKYRLGELQQTDLQSGKGRWELNALRYFAEQLLDEDEDPYWLVDELGRMFRVIARETDEEDSGERLRTLRQLENAIGLFLRVIDLDKNKVGESPRLAKHLNNVGVLLQSVGRLTEAESMMSRALKIDEMLLGPEHPDVARDLNNLAALLQSIGNHTEAEPLMRRALIITEKAFGPDHLSYANQLNNLAQLLRSTDRASEAEPLMHRALEVIERTHGASDPNMAISLNNLAQLLQSRGRPDEAEPLIRRALSITEQHLGQFHPRFASSLINLAELRLSTGQIAEAEQLMRSVLEIDKQKFGSNHPNVASDLCSLSRILTVKHDMAEAEALVRLALTIDEQSFDSGHPIILRDISILIQILKYTSQLDAAEFFLYKALKISEKVNGSENVDTLSFMIDLAELLEKNKKIVESKQLYESFASRVLKANAGVQPIIRRKAALQLFRMGKYLETEKLLQGLVTENFEIQSNLLHLARLKIMTWRKSEAIKLVQRAWQNYKEAPEYVLPRILWFQFLFTIWDNSQNKISLQNHSELGSVIIRKLKTVFQNEAVHSGWAMEPVLDHIKENCTPEAFSLLSALIAAINDSSQVDKLNEFEIWKKQKPVSLE